MKRRDYQSVSAEGSAWDGLAAAGAQVWPHAEMLLLSQLTEALQPKSTWFVIKVPWLKEQALQVLSVIKGQENKDVSQC